MPTRAQILQAIREDHPEFVSAPDDALWSAVSQDHPDIAKTADPERPRILSLEGAKISAPKKEGMLGKASTWMGDALNDVREGTTLTALGRGLHAMGARGTNTGQSGTAGELVASPVIGPIRMAQGATQIPQGKLREGTGNLIGGAMQAAQIPASFMAGPATEAVDRIIPSASRAGRNFETVMSAAKDVPIDLAGVIPHVQEAEQWGRAGASLPKVMTNAIEAVQKKSYPITYEQGRKMASVAGRPSIVERMSTNAPVLRNVKGLAHSLDAANRGAAESVGMAPTYDSAMREYRRAKMFGNVSKAVATGAALYGAKKVLPSGAISLAKKVAE